MTKISSFALGYRIALVLALLPAIAWCCCAVHLPEKSVLNADQAVIIVWDEANKTQHFIRKASFRSDSDDVGFLVPTPTNPELEESGNAAFDALATLTAPDVVEETDPHFGTLSATVGAGRVDVLQSKLVAGFNAVVLDASSASALNGWLNEHGYASSPEVEAWAKPYVDAGWKITAMKVAKAADDREQASFAASALRMSFKTDRPLFPYREPDYKNVDKQKLGVRQRQLDICFISDARFRGELTPEQPWTGQVVWAGKLAASDRANVLQLLKLPSKAGPSEWYLTEFEDNRSYELAPADVYFTRDTVQTEVRRPARIVYLRPLWARTWFIISAAIFVFVLLPVASLALFLRVTRRKSADPLL